MNAVCRGFDSSLGARCGFLSNSTELDVPCVIMNFYTDGTAFTPGNYIKTIACLVSKKPLFFNSLKIAFEHFDRFMFWYCFKKQEHYNTFMIAAGSSENVKPEY